MADFGSLYPEEMPAQQGQGPDPTADILRRLRSTQAAPNRGIGSDYAADRSRNSIMPDADTMRRVNAAYQRMWTRGYADGGRPTPGQPALVGERGPELFVPDQPGTVVPNDPTADILRRLLFMRSGQVQAPPEGMTPFPAHGSGRKQRLPLPYDEGGIESWQDVTPAHAAMAATMIPGIGGVVKAGLTAAPKTAAAALTAGGVLGATSQAGLAADQVDPIQGEIDAINARLGKNNDEVVRLGTTMTKSPKGTQASAIDTLKGSIAADQARLQVLQGQFADRETERKAAADLKHQQEAPFQERFAPYSYAAPFVGPAVAMATNYGLGRYLGAGRANAVKVWEDANKAASTQFAKKGGIDSFKGKALAGELAAREARGLPLGNSPLVAGAAAGGVTGALEGGAVPYFMNEYDAQTLPPGSPNQVASQNAATNPNWWLSKVALPAGMGGIAGAFGGYRGVKAKGPYADPSPKTIGLLGAIEARAAQEEAAAAALAARQMQPRQPVPMLPSTPQLTPDAVRARNGAVIPRGMLHSL